MAQEDFFKTLKRALTTVNTKEHDRTHMRKVIAAGVALGIVVLFNPQQSSAQATVFTYQGKLNQNGAPFTGVAEIAPILWDGATGGNPVATNVPASLYVNVTNGLFVAPLDFGASPFSDGAARWLQLSVRTTIGPFTTLTPLQPLTATPYAITAGYAGTAATALSVSGTMNVSNLVGTIPLARLSGITSNQMDASTWQFIVNLASPITGVPTSGTNGMVLIPRVGAVLGDTSDGMADATPIFVRLSPFFMDANLVTWAQWQEVYAYATNHGYALANSGAGKGPAHPVQMVSWHDAIKWCNARSEQAGKVPVYYTDAALALVYRSGDVAPYVNWSAKGYRLPTEAEWEIAARGGVSRLRFPWGDAIAKVQANYFGNTNSFTYDQGPEGFSATYATGGTPYTSPVGSFEPNGYGLYDMAGNVWQWCWDFYGTPYAGGADPHGPASGSFRVFRGGSWTDDASTCRSAARGQYGPTFKYYNVGFRSVLLPGQ